MATNPAHVSTDSAIAPRYGEIFNDFLRKSPALIDTDFIRAKLLGTGEGFMTPKHIANRVNTAQTKGILTTRDARGYMKNRLSEQEATEETSRNGAKMKKMTATAQGQAEGPPSTNGSRFERIEKVISLLEEADELAGRALLDEPVSSKELIDAILRTVSAFNAAFGRPTT